MLMLFHHGYGKWKHFATMEQFTAVTFSSFWPFPETTSQFSNLWDSISLINIIDELLKGRRHGSSEIDRKCDQRQQRGSWFVFIDFFTISVVFFDVIKPPDKIKNAFVNSLRRCLNTNGGIMSSMLLLVGKRGENFDFLYFFTLRFSQWVSKNRWWYFRSRWVLSLLSWFLK